MEYLENLFNQHEQLLPTRPLKALEFDKDNVLPCVEILVTVYISYV